MQKFQKKSMLDKIKVWFKNQAFCFGGGCVGVDKNKKGDEAFFATSPFGWAHLGSNQAPTDYESVALTE